MADPRVQRRLAAILAADVAGYSRLMGHDEEGTLAALKACRRELTDPKVAEHHGRIVKTTGDGILAEFASAVDAVRCAVEIQRAMAERNSAISEERRIEFRIGINIGDVLIDEGDIFGDGVNIAARLEALASPGAICLSEDAYNQIKNKLTLNVSDIGEQRLKNIVQQVRVYAVWLDGAVDHPTLALPDKPSIAVLPFQNMSGDPEQEYFADGMVEEIITALSRVRWLFVIARNSSFIYKGRAVDVKQIGRELGVRYVLEGSVRKSGARIRITAQLIDALTGAHLWADRYDRDLSDIFAVQDEITSSVAAIIEPALAEAERQRVLRKPPGSLDVWETYQRGLWHFYKYDADENRVAQNLFRRAIQLDPNFAAGHHGLAFAQHLDSWLYSTPSWTEVARSGLEEARTAVLLDEKDSMAHAVLSFMQERCGDWESAIAEGRAAVSLNPNSVWSMVAMGHALGWGGYQKEGIEYLRAALRASPHDPLTWLCTFWIGIFSYFSREYVASIESMNKVIQARPGFAQRWRAAALGQLGRMGEAKEALELSISIMSPEVFGRLACQRPPWTRPEDYDHYIDGLRKAGWKGYTTRNPVLAAEVTAHKNEADMD
jgi:adenylate cyclase